MFTQNNCQMSLLSAKGQKGKHEGADQHFCLPISPEGDGLAQWLVSRTTEQGVPGSRPGRFAVRCGLEQVTFTPCLVLVKPRKPWTYD